MGDDELMFFSLDTDVLVLIIANYDLLPKKTSISMALGILPIEPFWTGLGAKRGKALPAFHTFTSANNTGNLARMGTATWLEICLEASADVINALITLLAATEVTEDQQYNLCAAH
ncbi:MAG: hypothetical protein M3H12_12300 [Chromatiales bacterium]